MLALTYEVCQDLLCADEFVVQREYVLVISQQVFSGFTLFLNAFFLFQVDG